jgi:hypothetical protein
MALAFGDMRAVCAEFSRIAAKCRKVDIQSMKWLLFIALVCSAMAQVPRSENYPPSYFSSREEAISSVKKAFAGGSFQELDVANKKVVVLFHYASGAFSSDAAVYVEERGAWRLLAYYAPILNDSIDASSEGDLVVLRAFQNKQVLLTVSANPKK